ncbi:MAG: hypothetical protein SF051_15995 [Elusimicrobiota bacterium]|nr:hypothetical protein [Elusimicrobiota bacterium]
MRRFTAPLAVLLLAAPVLAEGPLAQLQAAAAGVAVERAPVQAPVGRPVDQPGRRRHPGGDDGRETAAAACADADFDSDRRECMQVVGRAYYFDAAAVAVCRRVNFSSEVPACIAAIADKTFLRAETESCARESFGSGIVSCFQQSGRSTERGRDGDARLRRQLRRVQQLLRDGRYREAERELDDLIGALED